MQWAPDSPDLWAPDSGRPNQWAPDTFEHLTLRRGVDLFLGAQAAEGAAAKALEWYGTHDARHGQALRRPCRRRPRGAALGRVTGRPAHGHAGAVVVGQA
jgi:hypothetical protein